MIGIGSKVSVTCKKKGKIVEETGECVDILSTSPIIGSASTISMGTIGDPASKRLLGENCEISLCAVKGYKVRFLNGKIRKVDFSRVKEMPADLTFGSK